jgi:hypothetical protein
MQPEKQAFFEKKPSQYDANEALRKMLEDCKDLLEEGAGKSKHSSKRR